MIWGYRHHLPGSGYLDSVPLSLRPREGTALPRRAVEMHADAPGVILISNAGVQIMDFSRIDIGDLVFFDADPKDGDALDHVGMYFGRDVNGRYRFISSRKTPDGPTFADRGGPSLLDGKAKYARSFRASDGYESAAMGIETAGRSRFPPFSSICPQSRRLIRYFRSCRESRPPTTAASRDGRDSPGTTALNGRTGR
jgi:hypothetical protein